VCYRQVSEALMAWRRGQCYSQDLRDRVLAADHLTARQAAARFEVSVSYVVKARQHRARTGSVTPRPQKPCAARRLVHLHAELRDRLAQVPDATLAEHREWLSEAHGVVVGLTTVWKTLAQLGLTLKKSHSRLPSRYARMSPRRAGSGTSFSPSLM
jgi:transposase